VLEVADAEQGAQRSWTARLIAFAVVAMLLVGFVAQNFVTVEVRLLLWRVESRLAWALLLAGALGFILGLLAPRLRRIL
jgi:uncharacterized integral membrane protein